MLVTLKGGVKGVKQHIDGTHLLFLEKEVSITFPKF